MSVFFTLIQLALLLIAIILHEIAHGYVAWLYGDPTAKNQGRLSVNPLKHIDPMGSIIVPGLLMMSGSGAVFGWAKPVPVQPQYFSRPRYHMMLVALAGPLTNFTLAALTGMGLKFFALIPQTTLNASPLFWTILAQSCLYFIQLNVLLAVFNLIPIPPLDGSRILSHFAPTSLRHYIDKLEPYGFVIVYLCLFIGIIPAILQLLVPLITNLFLL